MKYIDDNKNVENIITSIQLTVDILLTFSGIGNLSKLRHIRTAFKLGRVALGLETAAAGDVLASYEFARGVLGVVEITGSLGNIFILYGKKKELYCDVNSNEYDKAKCEFYTKLDNIFIAMQLFGGVLDLATSKLISNSSRRLLQGPIPDDFNPDALGILRKFAGDIDELKEIFRVRLINEVGENSVIWKRIERAGNPGEFTIAKRDEFITDFERIDKDAIKALNDDNTLIDIWRDVEDLDNFATLRRDVNFLKDLKFIKNESDDLNIEIFKGKNGKRLKNPSLNPNLENSYTWIGKGVHHQDALLPPNPIARLVGDKQPLNDFGYYKVKVEIYNEELTTKWKVKNSKKGMSTFFPDSWSKTKVQQELALAWGKRKYSKANQYTGKMSDGIKVRFYLNNDMLTSAHPNL